MKLGAPNVNDLVSGKLDRSIISWESLEDAMDYIGSFETTTLWINISEV